MSGTEPTAVNLVVDGNIVATATGQNSPNLDWVAWDTSALKGKSAHIEVVDQRTADWGHLIVDNIVFSDVAAGPWDFETTANLVVDGKVVRLGDREQRPGAGLGVLGPGRPAGQAGPDPARRHRARPTGVI